MRRERQREADSERDREGYGERDSEAEKGGRRGCESRTELVRKRPGSGRARETEGGKEWSRRGPIEAQREIERGKRNREPKSFERVRRSGRDRF